ncbi:hypothetical protein A4G26_16090 [Mycobacterium kansasii]|nr:hypothetical protein A4G26_16090 [Mycobacterium kansasii]
MVSSIEARAVRHRLELRSRTERWRVEMVFAGPVRTAAVGLHTGFDNGSLSTGCVARFAAAPLR